VGRSYRRYNNTSYPEEKEGNAKDANKKLKAEIKNLKKIIKNLESENKTLTRSFNKSCDFINNKLADKKIEQIIEMINEFDQQEVEEKKRKEEVKKKEKKLAQEKECPKCFMPEGRGYKIIDFSNFKVHTCVCGYRARVDSENEGIERS
jgi:predicted RNase H-like nuclease (RuvC/YqgF family)